MAQLRKQRCSCGYTFDKEVFATRLVCPKCGSRHVNAEGPMVIGLYLMMAAGVGTVLLLLAIWALG
jgi:hypothetical protein